MLAKKRKFQVRITDIPYDILRLIASFSPKEFLSLSKYLSKIAKSTRTTLNVSRAHKLGINPKLVVEAIFSSPNIITLNVGGWPKWDNSCLDYLSKKIKEGHFRSLKHLHMSNCNNITNKSLRVLLSCLGKRLKTLDVYNCKHIDFYALTTAISELETLLLGYSKAISSSNSSNFDVIRFLFEHSGDSYSRIVLPKLKVLQICNTLDIKLLSPLKGIATTLRVLDIRGCKGIPKQELDSIEHLTNLEELYIGMNIENETLSRIAKNCTKLSVLDISESQITSQVVNDIVDNLPLLEKIKLSKCGNLNNHDLRKLLTSLSHLSVIDVSHCWRLTDSFSHQISTVSPELKTIGVYMCSLDYNKLVYNLNLAGASDIAAVTRNEVHIVGNQLHA
ncbi:hypothetical protein BEWA_008250 [Theileria equi strain WA]|uniref:Uncharacterized protein n=1 Tax=Theileria equi strain WA TaxID=1537102 RepID=L0B0T7_THEEQ|nr:hypothetical protein BEWA_008250 [Theileria equi strain WA]AFZ81415.1 hypothetical protein BEWA_008250 [Theileria equi strain WA]|eukprot:XP_004831081.1 hypothetical protein BEWA_008250 [Theileria equi strain WA]